MSTPRNEYSSQKPQSKFWSAILRYPCRSHWEIFCTLCPPYQKHRWDGWVDSTGFFRFSRPRLTTGVLIINPLPVNYAGRQNAMLPRQRVKVRPPSVDGYFGAFFRMLQIESFHHYFDAECIQNHFRNIVESCLAIKTLQCLYKPIISPSFSLDLTPKSTNFLWNSRIFYFRVDFRPKFGKSTSEKCKNRFFQTK